MESILATGWEPAIGTHDGLSATVQGLFTSEAAPTATADT